MSTDPAVCFEHTNKSGSVFKVAVYWDTYVDCDVDKNVDWKQTVNKLCNTIMGGRHREDGIIIPPVLVRMWLEGDGPCDNIPNDTIYDRVIDAINNPKIL